MTFEDRPFLLVGLTALVIAYYGSCAAKEQRVLLMNGGQPASAH